MDKNKLNEIKRKGSVLKKIMSIIAIIIGFFMLLFLFASGFDGLTVMLLLLVIGCVCLSFYGNKMNKEPDKFLKNYSLEQNKSDISMKVEHHATIEKIIKIIDTELKNNLPDVKKSDLEENGKIYYMNGQNGTLFDWVNNEKTSDFMCFYKDGSCGAIKLRINKNGTAHTYLYRYGEDSSFIDKEILNTFDKKEVYELVIILNNIMDNNGIFDRAINDYNSNIKVIDNDINEFEKLCAEMKG